MDEYEKHKGHDVEWECYEGGMFRLFCLTCKTFLQIVTYIPLTLARWVFGVDRG